MSQIAYELESIQHYYGEKKVLDIDALQISKGSITGLTGPNGSGKSTLLKIMAFALKPSVGEVFFNGRKEFVLSPRVRSRVTLLTQKPYLLKRSVFDNIAYGLRIRKEADNLTSRVEAALESVGLSHGEFALRQWHELSGGEAQRVAMAARLILKPEVLLLDEPVASVDTQSAELIRTASMAARKDWGCTLIIASHDLPWLYECTDTRISMTNGKVFSTGRENIIPPPYDLSCTNHPVRCIDKGKADEQIRLPAMEKPGTIAVIRKEKIRICLERDETNGVDNQITAEIIAMRVEKDTGQIMTTLRVNDFALDISLPPDQARTLKLLPGKRLILMFHSRDIKWR